MSPKMVNGPLPPAWHHSIKTLFCFNFNLNRVVNARETKARPAQKLQVQPGDRSDTRPKRQRREHDNDNGGIDAIHSVCSRISPVWVICHWNVPSTDNQTELTIFCDNSKQRKQMRCSKICCSTLLKSAYMLCFSPGRSQILRIGHFSQRANRPGTDDLWERMRPRGQPPKAAIVENSLGPHTTSGMGRNLGTQIITL